MLALARGDRSAFQTVFSALWPFLRQFCGRVLHDDALAEDAAQAALMKVFLRATDFRLDGDVVAWALGIAVFECRSLRNRRTRRGEEIGHPALATVPVAGPTPEDAAIEASLGSALREVLQTLRPLDRETLEGFLAPTPAVRRTPLLRKRLQRALERLRTAWRETHGSDD
jgi:RNA polymerase sigma-70 factor (ECF subfamily)